MKVKIAIIGLLVAFLGITSVEAQRGHQRNDVYYGGHVVKYKTHPGKHYYNNRYKRYRHRNVYRPYAYRHKHIPPGHLKKMYGHRSAKRAAHYNKYNRIYR